MSAATVSGNRSLAGLPSLSGKRIVVTRPQAQAAVLAEKLAALGAVPVLFPTIAIVPLDDLGPLEAALGRLGAQAYQWLIFTSANAVSIVCDRLAGGLPAGVRLAAVGPATARVLAARGLDGAVIPEEYVAEALAASLGDLSGQRVLLPQAEQAREALAAALRQRGAVVDEIVIYRTVPAAPDAAALAELRRGADAVTFTSGSAARSFVRLLPGWPAEPGPRPLVACLGPVTADVARQAGLPVDVVAAEHTLDGLIAALAEYWGAL